MRMTPEEEASHSTGQAQRLYKSGRLEIGSFEWLGKTRLDPGYERNKIILHTQKNLTKHQGKNNYTGSLNTQACIGANHLSEEPVSKCSILFKVKEGENFNLRRHEVSALVNI